MSIVINQILMCCQNLVSRLSSVVDLNMENYLAHRINSSATIMDAQLSLIVILWF